MKSLPRIGLTSFSKSRPELELKPCWNCWRTWPAKGNLPSRPLRRLYCSPFGSVSMEITRGESCGKKLSASTDALPPPPPQPAAISAVASTAQSVIRRLVMSFSRSGLWMPQGRQEPYEEARLSLFVEQDG